MNFIVLGVNHKTTPIEIREKFFLSRTEQSLLLSELKSDPRVTAAVLLSTCNRTEIYAHLLSNDSVILQDALFRVKELQGKDELRQYFYAKSGEEAVRHLFRVASGLDSVILGEKQILGQVKTATEVSREAGMLDAEFNILLNMAVRTGKKVRNETAIDFGGSSASWAAVKMAQELAGSLADKSVLIIGAGKMGKLAASQLKDKGIGHVYVLNRSYEKAVLLAAEIGGTAVNFGEMGNALAQVDVCICSTDAPHYVVEYGMVESAMARKGGKKLVCIDISVPRNIDPRVRTIPGIALVAIDDLGEMVKKNMQVRYSAVEQAENIIQEKVAAFQDKLSRRFQYDQEMVLRDTAASR